MKKNVLRVHQKSYDQKSNKIGTIYLKMVNLFLNVRLATQLTAKNAQNGGKERTK